MRIYALSITDLISERHKLRILSTMFEGKSISITNEIIALTKAIQSIKYTLGSYNRFS